MSYQELSEAEKLLKVALHALNSIRNTTLGVDDYKDTYDLCSTIESYFKSKPTICTKCNGKGWIKYPSTNSIPCGECNGRGINS